jgi:hypothetical protein
MMLLSSSNNVLTEQAKNKYIFSFIILILVSFICLVINPKLIDFIKDKFFFAPTWSKGMSFNPIYYLIFLGSKAIFPIGIFFVIGSIQIIIRNSKPGLFLIACVISSLIIISLIPSGARGTRYIFHIFPMIIIIASFSFRIIFEHELKIHSDLFSRKSMAKNPHYVIGLMLFASLIIVSAPWVNYIYRFTADYYHVEAQLGTPYRNWKDGCKYVREAGEPGDIIITTEALTASYYECGDIKYTLSKRSDRKSRLEGIKKITSLDDLKKVISENSRGWMIIDADRFNSKRYISKEIRDFMSQNLSSFIIDPHGTIIVFSWDEK